MKLLLITFFLSTLSLVFSEEHCNACKHRFDDLVVRRTFRNLVFSTTDHSYKAYCEQVYKDLQFFEENIACLQGKKKEMFQLIVDGYKKTLEYRCDVKNYDEQLVGLVECAELNRAHDEMHNCVDKHTRAFGFVVNSLPENRKRGAQCCLGPLFSNCIERSSTKLCDATYGKFYAKALLEPFTYFFKDVCENVNCEEYEDVIEKYWNYETNYDLLGVFEAISGTKDKSYNSCS